MKNRTFFSVKLIVVTVAVVLLFMAGLERLRDSRTVLAAPAPITQACQRPLDEYLLRAERLLDEGAGATRYSAENGPSVAIGYLLLHNACASKQQ